MTSPTLRQLEVLRFMAAYQRANGTPPTIREIGVALNISSTNAVNDHLKALVRKRLLERRSMKARSFVITALGHRHLTTARAA